MSDTIKRIGTVFVVMFIICFYIIQIILFGKLGSYLDELFNMNSTMYCILTAQSIIPLWINIPLGLYSLVSWIITGKIYKAEDYAKLYEKRKIYKTNKVQMQVGNLSISENNNDGELSIL